MGVYGELYTESRTATGRKSEKPTKITPPKRLNFNGTKLYKIGTLFRVEKGTRLTKANMKEGNINFIGASGVNNGVTAHIGNNEHLHPGNTITVNYNGSVGEAFYQKKTFWASDDVNVLYPKFELNPQIALFLLPIIKRVGKRYAFVNKWKQEDMENDEIPLPANKDGLPNWQYMADFISVLYGNMQNNVSSIRSLNRKCFVCD